MKPKEYPLDEVIIRILNEREAYGRCHLGRNKRILLEFVSANPIAPLNLEQGRQAVLGSVLANLLDAIGFKTYREYYLNDAPHEIDRLTNIREDLAEFGIYYDNWFYQSQFIATTIIDKFLKQFQAHDDVYLHAGELYFRSSKYKNAQDCVLIRANGERTDFAKDVAYHVNKFERGFDVVINLLAANQSASIASMHAALSALQINPERLINLLVQNVTIQDDKPTSPLSLRQLRSKVGNEVVRFFFIMCKYDQPLVFNIDLANAHTQENPAYYVQSAYAQLNALVAELGEREPHFNMQAGLAQLSLLTARQEYQLLNTLARYPDTIINAALNYEPHLLTTYLHELARDFYDYADAYAFLIRSDDLHHARLCLLAATQQIFLNGFNLLGMNV